MVFMLKGGLKGGDVAGLEKQVLIPLNPWSIVCLKGGFHRWIKQIFQERGDTSWVSYGLFFNYR